MLKKKILFLALSAWGGSVLAQGTQSSSCLNAGAGLFVIYPIVFILTFLVLFLMKSSRDEVGALKGPNFSQLILYFFTSILVSVPAAMILLELMC